MVRITGKEALCAGVIAEKYQEMGGDVQLFGKPYVDVYNKAYGYLVNKFDNIDKSKIAMIGDSLITDIKGANNFDIDSYLIPGGILARDLDIKHGQLPELEKAERLFEEYQIKPTAMLANFVW